MVFFYLNNLYRSIGIIMTNFLFVFSYQNGSDMELCYRLEVEAGEEKNECIEKTENFTEIWYARAILLVGRPR